MCTFSLLYRVFFPARYSLSGYTPDRIKSRMEFATLYLANDLCGCGDVLDRGRNELAVIDMRQAPESEFEALTCFVTPEVEAVKTRSERGSAFIDFVVN